MDTLSIIIGESRQDFLVEESLVSIFKATSQTFPDKIALYYKDKSITYKTLDEWSDAIANQLQFKGLKNGDACLVTSCCYFSHFKMWSNLCSFRF